MSLETEENKIELTPTAGTTVLDVFPIPYFDNTDIVVTIEDASGDVSTLEYITDYGVVATNGDTSNGCTVTLQVATVAGDTVVISRQVPYTQQYDLQSGSTIVPAALNTALDRTVAQSQQLLDDANRHVTHPITDPSTVTYEAPSVINRANKALGYDGDGNVTALAIGGETGVTGVDTNKGLDLNSGIAEAKVDETTTTFDSGNIAVKDGGIDSDKIDNSVILAVINATYPVGSIYTNATVSTNPATLLGVGTWTAFGAGRVIVGLNGADTDFDTIGETGGTKSETLDVTQIPPHTHDYTTTDTPQAVYTGGGAATAVPSGASGTTDNGTGGGLAHNNLQPYVVCYMWKRTA